MKIKYPYTKRQSPTLFISKSHPSHFCTKLWSKTQVMREFAPGQLLYREIVFSFSAFIQAVSICNVNMTSFVTSSRQWRRLKRWIPKMTFKLIYSSFHLCSNQFVKFYGPPWGPGGLSRECAPPYPQRDRKRRLNGAVCRNHRIKRLVPCRC